METAEENRLDRKLVVRLALTLPIAFIGILVALQYLQPTIVEGLTSVYKKQMQMIYPTYEILFVEIDEKEEKLVTKIKLEKEIVYKGRRGMAPLTFETKVKYNQLFLSFVIGSSVLLVVPFLSWKIKGCAFIVLVTILTGFVVLDGSMKMAYEIDQQFKGNGFWFRFRDYLHYLFECGARPVLGILAALFSIFITSLVSKRNSQPLEC